MKKIIFLAVLILVLPLLTRASVSDGVIDSAYRYAWSDKVGQVDMANVKISDTRLSGTAISSQAGIINFDDATFQVTNDGNGNLKGSAYGTVTGLINFAGVTIDSEGYFNGVADGGFMSGKFYFNCVNNSNCPDAGSARVRTDWRPVSQRAVLSTTNTMTQAVTSADYSGCSSLNDYVTYSRCIAEVDAKKTQAAFLAAEEPKSKDGEYSLSINQGAVKTNSTKVVLNITAPSEAVDMVISKDNNFGFFAKEKVSATRQWQIDEDEAVAQYVYIKFYDASGKPLKVLANSIILDKRQGDAKAEQDAKLAFKLMFGKAPKSDSQLDNEALKIIAYGMPSGIERDLVREKAALARFTKIYKHAPTVDREWNIVKGYAYAGAVLAKLDNSSRTTETTAPSVTETSVTNDCRLKIKLTKNLDLGASGTEVKSLQASLVCQGLLKAGDYTDGQFDEATESAVMAFQKERQLLCKNGKYCGAVGPATRNQFNALSAPKAPAVEPSTAKQTAKQVFVRNLTLNMSGDDVSKLQSFLAQDKALYPEAKVTGQFGPATEAAVKRFQERHGLKCADGTYCGYIGPATRNKLNSLYSE